MKKRLLSLLLCVALLITSMAIPTLSASAAGEDSTEYEIYPVPQSVSYTGKTIAKPKEVNLVLTDSLDDATKKKIKTVLEDNGISFTEGAAKSDGFNVVVAVNEPSKYRLGDVDHSNTVDAADATFVLQYFSKIITDEATNFDASLSDLDNNKETNAADATLILQIFAKIIDPPQENDFAKSGYQLPVPSDENLFDKTESYILSVEDNAINIVGNDTDGAFYGVVTLKWILEQCGDSIRTLTIEDYPDAEFRGFIEGYYGIPWSDEDRISLMEFGGNIKMTTYIFAPKDDPYHSAQWTTLYPAERLEEMKKMVQASTDSKCRFVWTIHPFMHNAITADNYTERVEIVKKKFQQLYDIGVRQFGILADDASSDTTIQRRLCIDMDAWCKEKGDVYDLLFCPQQYNRGWTTVDSNGRAPYFDTLTDGLPESVRIFWTGNSVCAPANQDTFDWFKEKVGGREALMWINWPCNDINSKRLLMGRGELLEENVTGFCGIVANPMQQAEPSKVALFAIADYTWNRDGWDMDESWVDSFKYIDPAVTDSLYTMAKHLSDPSPNGHGENLTESEEIKPLLDEFTTTYSAGQSIKTVGGKLVDEMEKIIAACNDFEENATVTALRDQMQPWTNSLRSLATAIKYYILTAIAFEDNNNNEVWANYSLAAAAYSASQNCPVQNLDNVANVEAGSKRLIPFASALADKLSGDVLAVVDPNKTVIGAPITPTEVIKSNDFVGYQAGTDADIYDGNPETYCWYQNKNNGADTVGANGYIGLDLGAKKSIGSVHIIQGCSAAQNDKFTDAVLEYSLDGVTYTEIADVTVDDFNIVLPSDVDARYVRLRTKVSTGHWFSISEFTVTEGTGRTDIATVAYTNVPTLASTPVTYTIDEAVLGDIDGEITLAPGKYLGVALSRMKYVDKVTCEKTGMEGAVLEYSANGVEWTEGAVTGEEGYRYVRLINKTKEPITGTITEFKVHSDEILPISVIENTLGSEDNPLAAFDGDRNTRAHFQGSQAEGKYVTYDLGQNITLNQINLVMYDGENDFIRNGEVLVSADNENWDKVLTLGNGSTNVEIGDIYTHDLSYYVIGNDKVGGIETRYIKILLTSGPGSADKWTRFSEIELNNNEWRPTVNDPTFDEEVVVKGAKTPYNVVDNNVNTTYLPESANSSVVYNVSENTQITSITLLQSPATVSNAKVSVRTGKDKWEDIGTLSESLNKFEDLDYENIFAVKIEWKDVIPELHEMFFTYAEEILPQTDKTELINEYNKGSEYRERDYTDDTFAALTKALKEAEGVINYKYSTDEDVAAAIATLDAAVKALERRPADKTELQALIQTAKDLDPKNYEEDSMTMIAEAIATAEAVVAQDPLYQSDADNAVEELQAAIDRMVMVGTIQQISADKLTGYAPSYQSGEEFANAVDGNDDTQWHSNWDTGLTIGDAVVDNYYTITLDKNRNVKQLEYLPRNTGGPNGIILGYKLYYSKTESGDDFVEVPGGTGTWENNNDLKTHTFSIQVNARRIMIVATSTAGSSGQENMFMSAREFKLFEIVPNA